MSAQSVFENFGAHVQAWGPIAAGGAILVCGLVEDFRSKKFPNWLFVACAIFGFATSIACGGAIGLQGAALGFLAGFATMLPLTLAGAVGAGDMKLLAAFGAASGSSAAWETGAFALVWGVAFGLARAAISGQIKSVFTNVRAVAVARSGEGLALHKIPFAAALFVGWLSALTYEGLI